MTRNGIPLARAAAAPAVMKAAGSAAKPRGIRQRMSELHVWAGLLVGWLLYAMFLTGTVSYFRDELSQWMRPELGHRPEVPDAAQVSRRIVQELQTRVPDSPQWTIGMPDARNKTAIVFWRKSDAQGRRIFESAIFDPATGRKAAVRETAGGDFFYRFHFNFHYMPVPWGGWLAGLCAMFMLVAIVSGVITHKKIFIDFFTFRWGKGPRAWLDAHNVLAVFGLPFHAMITYTGLVMLAVLYMPWGEQAGIRTPAERQQMRAEVSAFTDPPKASGRSVPLAPVDGMVAQAQARWGRDNIYRVTLSNPGDAHARVSVTRGEEARVSTSPQFMLFEGTTGRLLQVKDSVGPAAETRGVMFALHMGRFGDTVTRWLYFLVGLAGTAMVGTGLVLWTVKRRGRLSDPQRPYVGFRVVERLNIAAIAGLSIAMAGMLWANRLLPQGLAQRGAWEIHVFFIAWAAALGWAMLRPARRAWIELLWLGAAVLALLPVLNAVTTDRGLFASLRSGDWVFAGIDLTLLALAVLHALLAVRTLRHRPGAGPRARASAMRRRGATPDAPAPRPPPGAQPALQEPLA